jgi:hypothetical protein
MLNHPKHYLVQQSVEVAVCYEVVANSLEEAQEIVSSGDYTAHPIIDISVLDWDRPWDVAETEHWTAPMTDRQLAEWSILGI